MLVGPQGVRYQTAINYRDRRPRQDGSHVLWHTYEEATRFVDSLTDAAMYDYRIEMITAWSQPALVERAYKAALSTLRETHG
jgi:hypothetical protein